VIWSDECSVQLETHRRFCCCKKGEAPKSKPRYVNLLAWIFPCLCNLFSGENLYIVHTHPQGKASCEGAVWAAISKQGASGICIFEGIMVKEVYVDILEQTLLPFIHDVFPDGHVHAG